MSDQTVRTALRSTARLVLIEAPAGCGKTHQGADYARDAADSMTRGRPLIATHTHAACSVFAERTEGSRTRVEIRTLDSLIGEIATAYHVGLGLPADTSTWIRQRDDGYAAVAARVATLLKRYPMIASSLAQRYPVVVCDESQDSSTDQHAVAMALLQRGALLRVFADPMQRIFGDRKAAATSAPWDWESIKRSADAFEELAFPHRWQKGCAALGSWTLTARTALRNGGTVDLRNGLPPSVIVVYAENQARKNLEYQLTREDRKAVDAFERQQSSLLILTRHNQTTRSLRSFFNRRIPLWQGHTRPGLEGLVDAIGAAGSEPSDLARAVVTFMNEVGKGFSPSAFGDLFEQEAREGCTRSRNGKAAKVQELARHLILEPNHRGVARVLKRLSEFRKCDAAFAGIEVDCIREFWDAVHLGDFEALDAGLAEITHRRAYSRPRPPARAISTIHKAKGLECDGVILMPCDGRTFPDKEEARCLLYVALSRAKSHLMLVVSRANPSPLLAT